MGKYPRQKSFYACPETQTLIADSESLSRTINAAIIRLDWVVARSMPEFSASEWSAIFDANNGALLIEEASPQALYSMIWANVADAAGLGAKWGVDQDALVAKIRALSPGQTVALMDAIDKFWQHSDKPTDEAIRIATRQ